ncbi:MAG: CNNM domain-containing protein [Elusimicrobiales bacterium]
MTILAYLLVALGLLLLNGFFVLAEFSLVKVRLTRLEELASKGSRKARAAKRAVEKIEPYLATTQLGITMASLGLGWVGEPSVGRLVHVLLPRLAPGMSAAVSGAVALALAFIVITSAHIIIGEQVPKIIAIKKPDTCALWVSGPLNAFYRLTYYPMRALDAASAFIIKLLGFAPGAKEAPLSEEELKLMLAQSQEQGRLSLGRLLMFENIFDFDHSIVKEVMTPRDSAACLYAGAPWPENRETIAKRKFSRYPLCKSSLDDSAGYVFVKDIQEKLICNADAPDLSAATRPLLFFGENTPLPAVLREMQGKRVHLALVKDGSGRVSGLVTTEDIVEEIVGEIRDENEIAAKPSLKDLLAPDAFVMDMPVSGRFDALRAMLAALHRARPEFDMEQAWSAVEKREKLLSCALGHGAAFPHARLASLKRPLVSFARCGAGLDFPSVDGEPVRLLFLIITPLADPAQQLRTLSELARLVSNPAVRKRLLSCAAPADVLELVAVYERRVPLQ